jgi:hypothetical protein
MEQHPPAMSLRVCTSLPSALVVRIVFILVTLFLMRRRQTIAKQPSKQHSLRVISRIKYFKALHEYYCRYRLHSLLLSLLLPSVSV